MCGAPERLLAFGARTFSPAIPTCSMPPFIGSVYFLFCIFFVYFTVHICTIKHVCLATKVVCQEHLLD
jgi:hypothetical protein